MKTLISVLIAVVVAACIATVIALVPVLFQPVFIVWVIGMLLLMTAGEYVVQHHHYGRD